MTNWIDARQYLPALDREVEIIYKLDDRPEEIKKGVFSWDEQWDVISFGVFDAWLNMSIPFCNLIKWRYIGDNNE